MKTWLCRSSYLRFLFSLWVTTHVSSHVCTYGVYLISILFVSYPRYLNQTIVLTVLQISILFVSYKVALSTQPWFGIVFEFLFSLWVTADGVQPSDFTIYYVVISILFVSYMSWIVSIIFVLMMSISILFVSYSNDILLTRCIIVNMNFYSLCELLHSPSDQDNACRPRISILFVSYWGSLRRLWLLRWYFYSLCELRVDQENILQD